MAEEINLLFHVVYGEQESSLQFSKTATVADLKNQIFHKFGLAPYKQIIECWNKKPRTDADTLITCCLQSECNFLVVYNVEDDFQNNYGLFRDNVSSQENADKESESGESETGSVLSFIRFFNTNYKNQGVTFRNCCLDDALDQAFSTPKKQILLLYLHNENDRFSKVFCEQLANPSVQNILRNKYFVLCWDIKDDFKKILIRALRRNDVLKNFVHYIEKKISVALVIASKNTVVSVMKNNISAGDIQSTLETSAMCCLNEETSEEKSTLKHAFGSKEYQQLMLDMLGDRDYDSFDHYEFELLRDKIGYALYGPPKKETGYEEKELKKVDFLFKKIIEENSLVTKWKDRVVISFIYICMEPLQKEKEKRAKKFSDYDPYSDITPVPVFVLRKCKHGENACRIFIDDVGRVYSSWNKYLSNNKLPECVMVYPKNGRYQTDENENVVIERRESPACDISNDVLLGADIASAVGGIASGGAMVAAASIPAVAAAPFVLPVAAATGVAVGVYSIVRSSFSLHDRRIHRESLSFFESPEARGAYINIVAGALGFVGTGANVVVSKLAAEGFHIGRGATTAVNTLNIVNMGAGGAGIVNASYDVLRNWICENETPSALTIIQLSSSILFFGHAVYNYRSMGAVIEESQANYLKEYQDSLRSNRHRKTFVKLLKETIRQNDGNVRKGQAEVISTIKNIQNRDEVFATLTRSNKAMNRNNVRFAANNGEITLNGVRIDMSNFSNMKRNEVITFLNNLPDVPKPSNANIKNMATYINNNFMGIPTSEIANLAFSLVKLFANTDLTIKEKILDAVSKILKVLFRDYSEYVKMLDRIFPKNKYFHLITMVNSFFQKLVNDLEEKYARWLKTQNPEDEEPCFLGFLSLTDAQRIAKIFNIVTETYYTGTQLTEMGLKKLLEYFYTWFTLQVYSYEERNERRQRRREHSSPAPWKLCEVCGGYNYSTEEN